MEITEKTIEHLAELSRLYIEEKDVLPLTKKLGDILDYMQKINNSVDTAEVDKVDNNREMKMREDVIKQSFPVDELLKNCPERNEDTPVVPRVVD